MLDEEFRRESDAWGEESGKGFLRKGCFVKKFLKWFELWFPEELVRWVEE